jgi:hypothetical protein
MSAICCEARDVGLCILYAGNCTKQNWPSNGGLYYGGQKLVEPAFVCEYSRNKEFYLELFVRGRREVYVVITFPSQHIKKITVYSQNMNLMIAENENTCNFTSN